MAQNLFADNSDLQFHFANLDIEEIARLREKNYTDEGGLPWRFRDYRGDGWSQH